MRDTDQTDLRFTGSSVGVAHQYSVPAGMTALSPSFTTFSSQFGPATSASALVHVASSSKNCFADCSMKPRSAGICVSFSSAYTFAAPSFLRTPAKRSAVSAHVACTKAT